MSNKPKYFPERPDDVTCLTCPYLNERGVCVVGSPARQQANSGFMPGPGFYCGEHPWFAKQRTELDERQRQDVVTEMVGE